MSLNVVDVGEHLTDRPAFGVGPIARSLASRAARKQRLIRL
jgi:hypothetical protein